MSRIMPQIEHVVLLMLENRSLDNLLGWLYSGADQPTRIIHGPTNGKPAQYDGLGNGISYANELKGKSYPVVKGTPNMHTPLLDPNEEYESVNVQIFNQEKEPPVGAPANMGGFLKDYYGRGLVNTPDSAAAQILSTYSPKQLERMNGLAKFYAVSDRWFSSVPTQTTPNRAFMACGTSLGAEINSDMSKFKHETLWNVLSDHGMNDWGIYYHDDYGSRLQWTDCYTHFTFPNLDDIPFVDEHFCAIETFYERAEKGTLPAFSFLEPSWVADSGKLGNDYHPPANVGPGEEFVQRVYDALTKNRSAWGKTLFVITFDEHGGTWDHVPPPWGATPPDDKTGKRGFKFNRFGVRVPTLLISPLIEKSTVFRSTKVDDISGEEIPYDHTSLIATILKWAVPDIDLTKCGLGKRVPRAPLFDEVLTRTTPRTDTFSVKAAPFSIDAAEYAGLALNGFVKDLFVPVLASRLVGPGGSPAEQQRLVDEIRATCETQGDLDKYVDAYVLSQPPLEAAAALASGAATGRRVHITIKNMTRSRIWWWGAWGTEIKTFVPNPVWTLGYALETMEEAVVYSGVDAKDHQYYVSAAYWVGDDGKIPKDHRVTSKPQWRLIGAPSPGWMEIGHRQALVIQQSSTSGKMSLETES